MGVIDGSTDILAEAVDQAVHHFIKAVSSSNVAAVSDTARVICALLVDGAERNRRAAAPPLSKGIDIGVPSEATLPVSPSLIQWVHALGSLVHAALPAGLRYLQMYYKSTGKTQPAHAADACVLPVLNLVFFIITLHCATRRLYNSNTSSARQHLDADVESQLDQVTATLNGCLCDYLPLMCWRAEMAMSALMSTSGPALSSGINTTGPLVVLRGHPTLHGLPATPQYLTSHDAWVWVLVCACVHGTRGGQMNRDVFADDQVNDMKGDSSDKHGDNTLDKWAEVGSDAPTARDGEKTRRMSPRRPRSSPLPKPDDFSSAGNISEGEAAAGISPSYSNGFVEKLVSWGDYAQDDDDSGSGGTPFVLQVTTILLLSLRLFIEQWMQRQPLVKQLLVSWEAAISAHHTTGSSDQPTISEKGGVTSLELLLAEVYRTEVRDCSDELIDLLCVVSAIDALVTALSPLLITSAGSILRLFECLHPLATIKLVMTVPVSSHMMQRHESSVSTSNDFTQDNDELWKRSVLLYCSRVRRVSRAVSLLMRNVSVRILESDAGRVLPVLLPCEAGAAMLAVAMRFVLAECASLAMGCSCSSFAAQAVPRFVGSTTEQRPPAQQLRAWAAWLNAAHHVHQQYNTDDASEAASASQGVLPTGAASSVSVGGMDGGPLRRDRDACFVQIICVTLWHMHALCLSMAPAFAFTDCTMLSLRADSCGDAIVDNNRKKSSSSFESKVVESAALICSGSHCSKWADDELAAVCHRIFVCFSSFIAKLHEGHLAAIFVQAAEPLSVMCVESYNALIEVADLLVAATAPVDKNSDGDVAATTTGGDTGATEAVSHRHLWLLAMAHLRLSDISPTTTFECDDAWEEGMTVDAYLVADPVSSVTLMRDISYVDYVDWASREWIAGKLGSGPDSGSRTYSCRSTVLKGRAGVDGVRTALLDASMYYLLQAVASSASYSSIAEEEVVAASDNVSQARAYVDTFLQFVMMREDVTREAVVRLLLRATRAVLERGKLSSTLSMTGRRKTSSTAVEGWKEDRVDLLDIHAFELETNLFLT